MLFIDQCTSIEYLRNLFDTVISKANTGCALFATPFERADNLAYFTTCLCMWLGRVSASVYLSCNRVISQSYSLLDYLHVSKDTQ